MTSSMQDSMPPVESRTMQFNSRRSVVYSTGGMVACTQPLAVEAGLRILKMGGNAADAAVAVASTLNMTEPHQTGIGGDMFCLYWDASSKRVHALNGSGRSAKNTSLKQIREALGYQSNDKVEIPLLSGMAITVPGAAAGWCDTVGKFGSGKVTMKDILTPAIELGERGYPVSEISAALWAEGEQQLRDASPSFREMLRKDPEAKDGVRAPRAGEIMQNPTLAETFRVLATEGKEGFYTGRIAEAMVDAAKATGGFLELEDLLNHIQVGPHETQPISLRFKGQSISSKKTPVANDQSSEYSVELWEHPPNGQGIVALMALGILEELENSGSISTFSASDHNSVDYLHAVIESLRIAFADAHWWVTDPDHEVVKSANMISREYLAERAKLFDAQKAQQHTYGQSCQSPAQSPCDTVYFAVTDKDGNGMSFINSVYSLFGTGIIPKGCGFPLQNRGANFKLSPDDHPNIYRGGKRPYHTIIPGLLTHGEGENKELHSVLGVMGGLMQPQGHVQVLLNMEVFGMNPQQALDAPRICVGAGIPTPGEDPDLTVYVEQGIAQDTIKGLERLGHQVQVLSGHDRSMFGRGQIIRRQIDDLTGQAVYGAGSDPRGDGCAMFV